jgi:hypothetical protein
MLSDYSHAAFPGKPIQQGDAREAALADGLRELAACFGVTLREPLHIDSNGEFSLVVSNGTARDFAGDPCGQYGKEFADLIARYNPRMGLTPSRFMSPENGWCRMNHFDAQTMLERFARDLAEQRASGNVARKEFYTFDAVRSSARCHAAYRWSKVYHWNANGTPWTAQQRAVYDEEYKTANESERAREIANR